MAYHTNQNIEVRIGIYVAVKKNYRSRSLIITYYEVIQFETSDIALISIAVAVLKSCVHRFFYPRINRCAH